MATHDNDCPTCGRSMGASTGVLCDTCARNTRTRVFNNRR